MATVVAVLLLVLGGFGLLAPVFGSNQADIIGTDPRFIYRGRWESPEAISMKADWPCSAIEFGVVVQQPGAKISLVWTGANVRANVTINSDNFESYKVLTPPLVNVHLPTSASLTFPSAGTYAVKIRKISTSAPFGTGIGDWILKGSWFRFFGVMTPKSGLKVVSGVRKSRLIAAVGASDTAGWCVDGTPQTSSLEFGLFGWKYENCGFTYTADLGRKFNADVTVQAISGIGLIQNAFAAKQWVMGSLSMPGYYNRTLQNFETPLWDFGTAPRAQLLLLSLGGNDYNHQNGRIPSNASFTQAYTRFSSLLLNDNPVAQLVAVCGMGSPNEVKLNPDNNRCRPCPHVEDAVNQFRSDYPDSASRLHYIFVPCDGTVVTGNGDIGCNGHKNRLGQAEVADFLAPQIQSIMGW